MENLKIQLSNYAYMSYETYRVLKAKILELADKEIADLHEFMELATENEMERRAMCEDNSEIRQWEQRTKYINKLKKVTWKAVERELDRYDAIPIETHIKEADTVGFDKYIKTLSQMHDITVDQFYGACKDDQEVRDEIVGNFAKGMGMEVA